MYFQNNTIIHHLRVFAKTDIFVAPHGSPSTYVLWMRPRSAVVEVMPAFLVDNYIKKLSHLCRVQYFEVSDFDLKHAPTGYKKLVDRWYQDDKMEAKQKLFMNNPVRPRETALIAAVWDAYEYVLRTAGAFVRNDVWSPIFY